jgi:hypothetical protein
MAIPKHYLPLLLLIGFAGSISNCSPKKPAEQTFGELDKTAIAADTGMEADMDHSYEYQKALVESDSIVYDFLAYDKPVYGNSNKWESKLIIMRRTNNKTDTVVKDRRFGPVKGLSIADLDHDGRPEILFYEDHTADKSAWRLRIYSQKPDGTFKGIYWRSLDAKSSPLHYHAGDTFFVYRDHLIRSYPYYARMADTIPQGAWQQSYRLSNDQLILEHEKLLQ